MAVASLPLAFAYGAGVVPALAALAMVWPDWRLRRWTTLVRATTMVGCAGLALSFVMLATAVALCGADVLTGQCDP